MAVQDLYFDDDDLLGLVGGSSTTYALGYWFSERGDYEQGFADGIASAPQDEDPPTVVPVTPLGDIQASDEVVIDVVDDMEIAYIAVFAAMGGSNVKTPVFRRGAFEVGFTIGSFVEDVADPGVRHRLHIRRDTLWPAGALRITIDPVDGGGNVGA